MHALKHLAEKLHHHDKHAHDDKEVAHDNKVAHDHTVAHDNKVAHDHTVAHDNHHNTAVPTLKKDVAVTGVHSTTTTPHVHQETVVVAQPVLLKKDVTTPIVTETFEYETIVADPVIDERVRTDVLVEVQPVIHKEIDQEIVHHVEKHIIEAPAASRNAEVKLAPKIIEHVHTHVIEEVQPIIHREVAVQKVEKVEEFRTEHVVAPAQHLNEVTHEASTGKIDLHAHQNSNTHIAKPIIDERVRTDVLVEVQPIVHREVDRTIVNHVEKHITEAPAPSLAGRVQLAPKVEEQVHVHEVADIQPIVHREKAVVKVDKVEQHLTEHVTAPTAHTHDTLRERIEGAYTGSITTEGDHLVKAPIIDEKVRTDLLVEIQPVIHRDIDQNIVHHIEKHIDVAPAPSLGGVVTLAPKVEEHVHTRVVNEVQPVVHREVSQQKVERVEEHLTERVVAPATHTHEVLNETARDGRYVAEVSSRDVHVHAPIVDETLRTDVVVEIQPVVHKEIEQNVVRHVEKHIVEAPAPSMAGKVQLAPKVVEQVHTHTINEVQPIVHKENAVRVVEHKEEHTTDHVVAPTTHTHEKVVEGVNVPVSAKLAAGMQAGGKPVVTPLP